MQCKLNVAVARAGGFSYLETLEKMLFKGATPVKAGIAHKEIYQMTSTKPDADTDPRLETARENLRIAAAKRQMNFSEIARKAGMSRNGFQQFVTGRTSITYANLLNVCDVLQIPIAIVHKADAMTDAKIRLYRALDRMPDHLAAQALAETEAVLSRGQ